MGQKGKLTPELQQALVDCLLKGNYVSTACELVGLGETTFYQWLDFADRYIQEQESGQPRNLGKRNYKGEVERYVAFAEAIKGARAHAEVGFLGRIDEAGSVSTLIEQRTITHTLKDGSTKTETIEKWKPPDWTANAWILERTHYEKYGEHSSLDIQQAGVVFIERLQRARQQKVIDGEFREIEELATAPHPEEIPPERLLVAPAKPQQAAEAPLGTPRRRPIFELIAKVKAKQESSSQNVQFKNHQVAQLHKDDVLSQPPSATGEGEPAKAKSPTSSEPEPAPPKNAGVE